MTRTQIQFPDPLYERLKQIAEQKDWSLAEVVRRATELYVHRFPQAGEPAESWTFPKMKMGGDFLRNPADVHAEPDAVTERNR